jgi:salicylate hydroxylase
LASTRTIVIAGAGIGGLTTALAVARHGYRISLLEQAEQLEEVGAGLQLSPNASRVLIELGLGERLAPLVVRPEELRVMNARSGRVLAAAPLGDAAEKRYGAPYWVIHRGDLQAVLLEAAGVHHDITLQLRTKVEEYAVHANGVTVAARAGLRPLEERGLGLIGADGLWSSVRRLLGHRVEPRFARHTAWRALIPAETVRPDSRAPIVNLWLGRNAHVVHYPVRGGRLINVVAILRDDWREPGWSEPARHEDILARFGAGIWQPSVRELVAATPHWRKWALFDTPALRQWGKGPVTLLGDAAHPMLPYLAQGAAMAIEDAAVLSRSIARTPDNLVRAMRDYEQQRLARTARAQKAARSNGAVYHMGGAEAFLRTLALLAMGGRRVLRRYDWVYRWQPD